MVIQADGGSDAGRDGGEDTTWKDVAPDAGELGDVGPPPTTLASSGYNARAFAIAVDSTDVYWVTDKQSGAVLKCAKTGCGSATEFALHQGVGGFGGLAVDSTTVFWTDFGARTILACPSTGCPPTPSILASAQTYPASVALDGLNVYWTDFGGYGDVMRCAKSGCANAPTSLAGQLNEPLNVAVGSSNVYWTYGTIGDSGVYECPVTGCDGGPSPFAYGKAVYAIAADGANVYWTDADSVLECPLTGCGGNPTVLASSQGGPNSIASDGVNVYWVNSGGTSSVLKCAVGGCGGVPTVLAYSQPSPWAVAVDDTNVYWTNNYDGTVMTVPK